MSDESGHNRLTVYSRHDCHLCEEMIAGLQELQARFHFQLQVVDVDANPELERRYGASVPVLAHGERELCRHFLDHAAVTEFLGKMP
ncbi:MAG TPA: glutaredoxin family protein [Burkholderiales bacterium]|nr:glutaredoxin family protein [Burkholderiales bacterium]